MLHSQEGQHFLGTDVEGSYSELKGQRERGGSTPIVWEGPSITITESLSQHDDQVRRAHLPAFYWRNCGRILRIAGQNTEIWPILTQRAFTHRNAQAVCLKMLHGIASDEIPQDLYRTIHGFHQDDQYCGCVVFMSWLTP